MKSNIIYTNDDYDRYCVFCDENIPSLEWRKHKEKNQHNKNRAACNNARTRKGLFCKECSFLADNSWCRLANDGEEDLVLGKEFMSYTKEPMRSHRCQAIAGFGYKHKQNKPIQYFYSTSKHRKEISPKLKINAAIGDAQQGYSIFNRRLW